MPTIYINDETASTFTIKIDKYQRPFVWTIKNIEALRESIENNYFFGAGTFIDRGDGTIEVVDGQQRLIAIAMLSSNNDLNFHFQFANYDNRLNDIINGNFDDLILGDGPESAYLKLMKSLKEEIIAKGLSISSFSIPFIPIDESQVIKSFVSMNTHGSTVKSHDIYKAILLLNDLGPSYAEGVNSKWIQILNAYYDFIEKSKLNSEPALEMLFSQAFNSELGNTNINEKSGFISANYINWNEGNVKVIFLDVLHSYLKWAKSNLTNPDLGSNFNLEMLSIRDANYGVNGYSSILSFKWSTFEMDNYSYKYEIFALLHSINNLILFGDINKLKYKTAIVECVRVANAEAPIDEKYIRTKKILISFWNDNIDKASNFNEKFRTHLVKYSNRSFSNILTRDAKYIIFFNNKLLLRERVTYEKFNLGRYSGWNIEHILNDSDGQTDLLYLTLASAPQNVAFGNDDLITKRSNLMDGHYLKHPLFSWPLQEEEIDDDIDYIKFMSNKR